MGEIVDVLLQAAVLIRKHRCEATGAQGDKLDEALCDVLKALAAIAMVMAIARKPKIGFTVDLPL